MGHVHFRLSASWSLASLPQLQRRAEQQPRAGNLDLIPRLDAWKQQFTVYGQRVIYKQVCETGSWVFQLVDEVVAS